MRGGRGCGAGVTAIGGTSVMLAFGGTDAGRYGRYLGTCKSEKEGKVS